MSDAKTLDIESSTKSGEDDDGAEGGAAAAYALVLAWSARAPSRVGEVLAPEGDKTHVFGRGEARDGDGAPRVLLARSRPGFAATPGGPLDDPFVSRLQIELANHSGGMRVVGTGKRPLLVAGQEVTRAVVRPGETLEIRGQLLFVCEGRVPAASSRDVPPDLRPFGEADASGYVGESAVAWTFRERLAFVARREGHVLLLGPSGSGKELAAQAIHAQSRRASRRLVARNAATFPSGLIDAELFGNAANYPNAGMAERPGLAGEADGSTLFLDEIGELPENLQTHLLRVLDDDGEYQRLGDARRRKADLRLVAATNRAVEHLKADLAARLRLRLELPGLNDRRGDVALIARHLLRHAAIKDHEIGERFLDGWNGHAGEPRFTLDLMRALVTHAYATHVRELDGLVWSSLTTSAGNVAELTDQVRRDLAAANVRTPFPPRGPSDPSVGLRPEVSEEQVRASMAKHAGVKERVWRELGLSSRFALRRLLQKHGIADEENDA